MNMGKRIESKLSTLGWKRQDLLSRVPDLTAQALSNLIRRDSKRSEWDEAIANALGVSILWLVYGKNEEEKPYVKVADLYRPSPMISDSIRSFPDRRREDHPAITEVVKEMLLMDEGGKWMLAGQAKLICSQRAAEANPATSSQ